MERLKTRGAPLVLVGLLAGLCAPSAFADEGVIGVGRAPLSAGDASAVRAAAKQAAVRDAVLSAIRDATALDASDSKFAATVDDIAKQLRDVKVDEQREGDELVTQVTAVVDLRLIKAKIRGTDLDKSQDRNFGILTYIEEFLIPSNKDLNMPLRELVESHYDAGSSFSDKSLKASAASSSSNAAYAAASSSDSAAASAVKLNAADRDTSVSGQAAAAAEYHSRDAVAAAQSSKSQSASVDQQNVDAASHRTASYKHLIEYQDNSKPSNQAIFQGEFTGNLRDYDLRILDSNNVRSEFFGGKPLTLSALENGPAMKRFSEFARKKNAAFLMVGTSTVVKGDVQPATGRLQCVVKVSLKVFSTTDNEIVAAGADDVLAEGINIEDCAGAASKKVGARMSPVIASRVLSYWADRSARGRQYVVELRSKSFDLATKMAFKKAVHTISDDVNESDTSDTSIKYTITLKGKVDAEEAVITAVSSLPAFASKTLDDRVDQNVITVCIGKCPK
jgi:hypothetical protein